MFAFLCNSSGLIVEAEIRVQRYLRSLKNSLRLFLHAIFVVSFYRTALKTQEGRTHGKPFYFPCGEGMLVKANQMKSVS